MGLKGQREISPPFVIVHLVRPWTFYLLQYGTHSFIYFRGISCHMIDNYLYFYVLRQLFQILECSLLHDTADCLQT